jgi:Uma2 family endonuclease
MTVEPKLMTADELLRLPRGRARHALDRGHLLTLPLNDADHGAATANVAVSLGTYVRGRKLGRTTLIAGSVLAVDPDTVCHSERASHHVLPCLGA